ncbi:MAG TPA: hypothetical protein VF543_22435 [Pyrinomonadaceae bacterium]|jgi:hypothetical protein
MTLKRSYPKLEDVPPEYRSEYVPKDGEFVLDVEGFENVNKVLSKNQELLTQHATDKTEISTLKGQVTRLTTAQAELQSKATPDGHVPVPVADKQFLDTVKGFGDVAQVKEKLEKYPTLEKQATEAVLAKQDSEIEKIMGWKSGSLSLIRDKVPELVVRDKTENGQVVKNDKGEPEKVVIARIKGENETYTEKAFTEHFNNTPELKFFEPSLLQQERQEFEGTELPTMGAGGGGSADKLLSDSLINNTYDMSWKEGASAGGK